VPVRPRPAPRHPIRNPRSVSLEHVPRKRGLPHPSPTDCAPLCTGQAKALDRRRWLLHSSGGAPAHRYRCSLTAGQNAAGPAGGSRLKVLVAQGGVDRPSPPCPQRDNDSAWKRNRKNVPTYRDDPIDETRSWPGKCAGLGSKIRRRRVRREPVCFRFCVPRSGSQDRRSGSRAGSDQDRSLPPMHQPGDDEWTTGAVASWPLQGRRLETRHRPDLPARGGGPGACA